MNPLAAPASPGLGHESVTARTGERSEARMVVAIHSTKLGPALGGVRLWHYDDESEGVEDALRLSSAMTLKAAAAGLDLGGGKGVICAPPGPPPHGDQRHAILDDFGDLVESLDGAYITAEDVGTSTADMVRIHRRTEHVTGLPVECGGAGDPSPFTAMGVQAAMRAAAKHAFGSSGLAGRRVCVVGLGHVGWNLARGLAQAGAALTVADIDPRKRTLAKRLGARWVEPEEALQAEVEILAPCAVGGAIDAENVDLLACRILCGAANNQLADPVLDRTLDERGILFAPDFIANAGGLINVYRELKGYGARRATELTLGIESTMDRILARAATESVTPLDAATALARERLGA
ncbi:MAG: Glu/Leu/Phe/Val dehydrogenase family protein [Actinomycetota bacterium]|nr:Glu/Leu/Phe/Val dehydrogenase family protein [Actinomycetota bacterium]